MNMKKLFLALCLLPLTVAAQVKISQLPAATTVTGAEAVPAVQSGATVKVPVSSLGVVPQTAAELSAGVTPVNYSYQPYDVRRYGADPKGVALSDTAMANAIAACGTTGCTIRMPAGSYTFASQINLTSKHSITIEGDGGPTNNASAATAITYNGTAAPFVVLGSSFGCSVRKVVILSGNAGFTGAFIATSQVSGNPFMNSVEDVFLSCASHTQGMGLDTANTFLVKRTVFDHCLPGLTGQNSAGGSFSNVVTLIDNQFQQATGSYSIGYLGTDWTIIGNTFEPGSDGVETAITTTTTAPVAGVLIAGNFIGDATAASSPITLAGTGIKITGNTINAGAASGAYPSFTGVGPAITFNTVRGASITGNQFTNTNVAVTFGDANSRAIRISDNYLTNTNTLVGAYNTNAPYDLQFNPNYNASAGVQDFIPASGALFGNTAVNGFEVSQNGVIRMWGNKTVTAGTPLAITFSTEVGRAFPNAIFSVFTSLQAPGAGATGTFTSSPSITGVTLNVAGGTAASTVYWQAIGN